VRPDKLISNQAVKKFPTLMKLEVPLQLTQLLTILHYPQLIQSITSNTTILGSTLILFFTYIYVFKRYDYWREV
jgi:hypothetical protein